MPGYEPKGVPLWIVPVVPVCLLLGVLPIWYSLRRQRALAAYGRAARAEVTHTKRVHTGEHKVHRVHYRYTILSGATRTGSFDVNKRPPADGTVFTVLYDPDEPQRKARYPLRLVRVGRL
jgi:hypothetical protein